jgi:hypothetical protein
VDSKAAHSAHLAEWLQIIYMKYPYTYDSHKPLSFMGI